MTRRLEIYKCFICGNIVELIHEGVGQLVCCGQPMKLLDEQGADASRDMHVPIVERIQGGVRVTVGSSEHPMEEDHYIQWIEVIADGRVYRRFLTQQDAPECEFAVEAVDITAREYCKQHGLWRS